MRKLVIMHFQYGQVLNDKLYGKINNNIKIKIRSSVYGKRSMT